MHRSKKGKEKQRTPQECFLSWKMKGHCSCLGGVWCPQCCPCPLVVSEFHLYALTFAYVLYVLALRHLFDTTVAINYPK